MYTLKKMFLVPNQTKAKAKDKQKQNKTKTDKQTNKKAVTRS